MYIQKSLRRAIAICFCGAASVSVWGQSGILEPALPTLNIAPDARSSGMGDAGAATSPDISSQHWNAAKYAFMENAGGIGLSYVPWLRQVAKDVNLTYLSGYMSLSGNQALSASLYFFSLGNISLYSDNADFLRDVKPYEFAVDLAYSRRFGNFVSAALTFRYINSSKVEMSGISPYTEQTSDLAVDLASYWQHPVRLWGSYDSELAVGICISNIGTKVDVSDISQYFLPMNLRLGGRLTNKFNEDNSLTLAADLNKSLVPEDPQYSNEAVPSAMVYSFQDGFSSIGGNIGLEYMYLKQLAIRMGFNAESERMGGRRYLSFGAGLTYAPVTFDISYLTTVKGQDGVLSNTLHLTLLVAIKGKNR